MNDGKVGRPFKYAETYIKLLAYIRYLFNLPYRQTEGFARALSLHTGRKAPDYSVINRRINALNINLTTRRSGSDDDNDEEPMTIVVDSTGIKVTNRGEWLRRRWGKERKGYIKIHFAIDARSKEVISMHVTKRRGCT